MTTAHEVATVALMVALVLIGEALGMDIGDE